MFLFWTVSSGTFVIKFGRVQTDYYNALTHGFIQGHLYLDEVAPEAMTKLADPYDPTQNQGIGLHNGWAPADNFAMIPLPAMRRNPQLQARHPMKSIVRAVSPRQLSPFS
jgi:hypothetical protein